MTYFYLDNNFGHSRGGLLLPLILIKFPVVVSLFYWRDEAGGTQSNVLTSNIRTFFPHHHHTLRFLNDTIFG